MMPRKCELRPGAPKPLAPGFRFSRQLAGISGTSSDTVMSSQRKTEFNSQRDLADCELSVKSSMLGH